MQIRAKENTEEFGGCGCGRSPDGKCIGWHNLTEEQYKAALADYEAKLFEDLPLDQARQWLQRP